jgi:hypothetical protein
MPEPKERTYRMLSTQFIALCVVRFRMMPIVQLSHECGYMDIRENMA